MAKTKAEKKADKELLSRVRKRAKLMMDFDRENRQLGLDDLRFLNVPGEQWDKITRKERGEDRPMYESNKLRVTVKRIVNDMRSNRPQGKVRATEDGDVATANVFEGLIRNIWANADGDTVIDYEAEYQVGAGMGAWRVTVDYADDEAFEQTIGVDPIRNPFCLYADPAAQDFLKRDAEDWFLTDKISKASYQRRWPDAAVVDFEGDTEFDDDEDWEDDEKVRIGEYWYKEPYNKVIALLKNGQTANLDELTPELIAQAGGIVKQRQVRCNKIMMCIASGNAILEGPTEWAGSMFPFVQIYGEYIIIDGKVYWFGLTRFAKDDQRSFNYAWTSIVETIALAPQDKPWMTPKQIAGLETTLAEAHKKNYPFNLYNPDPGVNNGGPPIRQGGPNVPVALVQALQIAGENIKGVTGIYDASLGAHGNETSGKAINARQRQGEIATFNYMDNMAKGIRRTWEILVDLVPKIYDTPRSVRILGADGAEDYAKVNTIDPNTGQKINDLATGKYDVAITVGPSYATLRQEAAEVYTELLSKSPELLGVLGDIAMKSMDLPYAEDAAERMQAMLAPPIQEMLSKGKSLPPEVTAAMAQVKQAQAMVEQHGQLVQAAEQELKELEAKVKGDAASAKLAQANVSAAEAQLQAKIDAEKGELAMAQQKLDADRALLVKEVENAMLKIQLAQQKSTHAVTESIHHHEQAERDVNEAVTAGAHQLENQQRDVQDTVKDGSHQLEKQATQMSVQNMQAQHKQQLSQAKANKPKPAKK